MFLSFLVPVYNAEAYLEECILSLLRQDVEDYEILCVNDGSRDGSREILRSLEAKHPQLRVLDKENGGVTTARNLALEQARGDYVWFVDADDLVKENCLAGLKAAIEKTPCDRLALGAYQFIDQLSDDELARSETGTLPVNTPWYDAVVWRSLLRREFLLEHHLFFRYPELTHGEDGLFMYEVGLCHPREVVLEDVLYFYRLHSGSAESTVTPENRMRKLRSYLRIAAILRKHLENLENPKDGDGNKFAVFLWMALYEITALPPQQEKEALQELKSSGLTSLRQIPYCNITRSFMTDREDLVGKVFDKVYVNLHKSWGYGVMRLMRRLLHK